MIKRDFSKLFAAAQEENLPQISGNGSGKYSVSIVNSSGNGKRVTLSKALVEKLQLEGTVDILPVPSENAVMMGKTLSFPCTSQIELNSADKRTAYHANAVKVIVEAFGLDYSNKTSMSFNDIEFAEIDGVPIAVVNMPAAETGASA